MPRVRSVREYGITDFNCRRSDAVGSDMLVTSRYGRAASVPAMHPCCPCGLLASNASLWPFHTCCWQLVPTNHRGLLEVRLLWQRIRMRCQEVSSLGRKLQSSPAPAHMAGQCCRFVVFVSSSTSALHDVQHQVAVLARVDWGAVKVQKLTIHGNGLNRGFFGGISCTLMRFAATMLALLSVNERLIACTTVQHTGKQGV